MRAWRYTSRISPVAPFTQDAAPSPKPHHSTGLCRPGQEVLDLGIDDDPGPGRAGVITGKRSAVLWHVLTAVYARLGFDTIGDAAFEQLVLASALDLPAQ